MSKRVRIYAVTNQKGGLGKSTIGCNLVFAGLEAGLKVLVCDSDPQGSSSAFLSGDPRINKKDMGLGFDRVFDFVDKEDVELPTVPVYDNVDLLPGTLHLDAWNNDPKLLSDPSLVMRAGQRLRVWAGKNGYDRVVFDTPTGHGLLQVVPMLWSDVIYIPVSPEPLSMHMLPALSDTLDFVKNLNPLVQERYVINKIKKSSTQTANLGKLRTAFGARVMAEFKDSVSVSDSLDVGMPVWRFKGRKEVRETWRDFANRAMEVETA
ncbi:MAG TPA: ParA family protein [Noviherbaspirillum sp.]